MTPRFAVLALVVGSLALADDSANIASLKNSLDGVLANPARGSGIPSVSPDPRLDSLLTATAAEVAQLVPSAEALLGSKDARVRATGMIVLMGVAMRVDGAAVLSGQVPVLLGMLQARDADIRMRALKVVGSINPRPPREVVLVLLPHLVDTSVGIDELIGTAATLLRADYQNAKVVGAVIDIAKSRGDSRLRAEIVRQIGLEFPRDNDEAIRFIKDSFRDSAPDVRRSAVNAAGASPAQFLGDLRLAAEDPEEALETRQQAYEMLKMNGLN